MRQYRVQPGVVLPGAGLVVAVGPLALHQERPRHVVGLWVGLLAIQICDNPAIRGSSGPGRRGAVRLLCFDRAFNCFQRQRQSMRKDVCALVAVQVLLWGQVPLGFLCTVTASVLSLVHPRGEMIPGVC